MGKIIRLTESDLIKLVKRIVKEQHDDVWNDGIYIPHEYIEIHRELGENPSADDIIKLYNELEYNGDFGDISPLTDYSNYGSQGMFYNEEGDEFTEDEILGNINDSLEALFEKYVEEGRV
jgi:hypothetical protein